MNHFYNNGQEYLRKKILDKERKRQRLYRSRQGKSDKRYSRDMKLTLISYIGSIVVLLILILVKS